MSVSTAELIPPDSSAPPSILLLPCTTPCHFRNVKQQLLGCFLNFKGFQLVMPLRHYDVK